MTTIAVSKKEMACDLQATSSNGYKFKVETKILELPEDTAEELFGVKKVLMGFCGSVADWGEAVTWLHDTSQRLPRLRDIDMVALTSGGHILRANNLRNWLKVNEKFTAIGSGMTFALGALAAGKTPQEAVSIASKLDAATGMGVKNYTL